MTFADRLEELRKAATPGPWEPAHDGDSSMLYWEYREIGVKLPIGEIYSNMKDTDTELIAFLANNADAILELVRAAEIACAASSQSLADITSLRDVLAKLNGGQT